MALACGFERRGVYLVMPIFLSPLLLLLIVTVPAVSSVAAAGASRSLHLPLTIRRGEHHHSSSSVRRHLERHLQGLAGFDLSGLTPVSSASPPSSDPRANPSMRSSVPGSVAGGSFVSEVTTRSFIPEYFTIDLMVGTPPQKRSLRVGLNSYLTWTFCVAGQFQQVPRNAPNPSFDLASTTSGSPISCTAVGCTSILDTPAGRCNNDTCIFAKTNDDRSVGVVGVMFSDSVALDAPASRFEFGGLGCTLQALGSRINYSADGELALGPSPGSFLEAISAALSIPKVMSICFNSTGYNKRWTESSTGVVTPVADAGSVVFGAPPSGIVNGINSIVAIRQKVPTIDAPTPAYLSLLESWIVGSRSYTFGGDGQTTYITTAFSTSLPSDNLTVITDAISTATGLAADITTLPGNILFMDATSPTCNVESFPTIQFTFVGGATITARPEDYTIQIPQSSGCAILLGFEESLGDVVGLGTSVLQGKWLTFDLSDAQASTLRIGSGDCSLGSPA